MKNKKETIILLVFLCLILLGSYYLYAEYNNLVNTSIKKGVLVTADGYDLGYDLGVDVKNAMKITSKMMITLGVIVGYIVGCITQVIFNNFFPSQKNTTTN